MRKSWFSQSFGIDFVLSLRFDLELAWDYHYRNGDGRHTRDTTIYTLSPVR